LFLYFDAGWIGEGEKKGWRNQNSSKQVDGVNARDPDSRKQKTGANARDNAKRAKPEETGVEARVVEVEVDARQGHFGRRQRSVESGTYSPRDMSCEGCAYARTGNGQILDQGLHDHAWLPEDQDHAVRADQKHHDCAIGCWKGSSGCGR
ncbi:MAG: hypothetical protein BJ554DRAFT_7676, partial [Olpidium bornovanus]